MDSGATNHITNNLGNINIGAKYRGTDQLTVGNSNKLLISHIGHSTLATKHTQVTKYLYLNHILYVLTITKNLVYISKLNADNNVSILFDKNLCLIRTKLKGELYCKE